MKKMTNNELLERFRELEARLQKVNVELEGLRVAIKDRTFTEKKAGTPTKIYEVGEYVRVKPYEDANGFVGEVTKRTEVLNSFCYDVLREDVGAMCVSVDMLEKWQPQKGDLCIFGDKGYEEESVIELFDTETNEEYPLKSAMGEYKYCIPFISEQQYKRHIGYEE